MILVKFPSRERPLRFLQTLREWVVLAENITDTHFLFSFDRDDTSMIGMRDHIEELHINATVCWGQSYNKVHAINRDIELVNKPWDILLVISDDMWPVLRGWDSEIRSQMARHYSDGDGMLWFFDGKQKDITTLPCMGRRYYDRDGHVYHPSYMSVFPDNEQTDLARSRGRLTYFETVIAQHRHPANYAEVKPDGLHRRNETQAIWDRDQANYQRRKAQGFPA